MRLSFRSRLHALHVCGAQNVAGGLGEDVFEYTWNSATSNAIGDDADFEPERCLDTRELGTRMCQCYRRGVVRRAKGAEKSWCYR